MGSADCLGPMTRRRFHAPPAAFDPTQQTVTLTADEARHLRDVLRLKAGDEVYVFDGAGREFRCAVVKTTRDAAELSVEAEVEPAKPESQLQLNLCVALLKGEKFDLVVQKATELGATRVTPLITRYADIHLRDAADAAKRVARWQRIAFEAAKQSGRAFVPEIRVPAEFGSLGVEGLGVMFSERGGESLESLPRSADASCARKQRRSPSRLYSNTGLGISNDGKKASRKGTKFTPRHKGISLCLRETFVPLRETGFRFKIVPANRREQSMPGGRLIRNGKQ